MFTISRLIGIVIIIIAGLGWYEYILEHDWRYITPTDKQVKDYAITESKALNLYQLMKDAHEILSKHNIKYWIDGGTLLGAVRHKGIIPFDDDLDIGVVHEDEIKLQQILSEFKKLGYSVRYKRAYNICYKVCLDIFIFHKENNRFIHTNMIARSRWPNDFFYEYELWPLKKYQFGNIEVYGPNDPIGNLDRAYPEWNKYAIIKQPHGLYNGLLSNIILKTKFILTPELLKPAQPINPLKNRVDYVTK